MIDSQTVIEPVTSVDKPATEGKQTTNENKACEQPVDNSTDGLLTITQAAEFMAVRPRWVQLQVTKKKIPFMKLGHFIRFKKKDLVQFLESKVTRNAKIELTPKVRPSKKNRSL